jgi:hypothetical protein
VDQGAEPLATSDATFAHAGQELYHLSAEIQGAVTVSSAPQSMAPRSGSIF